MKSVLIGLAVVIGLVLLGLFQLAYKSKNPPALGIEDNQLKACYAVTNCVNSAASDASAIEPINFMVDPNTLWSKLPSIIESMDGTILQQDEHYFWLSFRSPVFGFVDDMELLLDADTKQIQVRAGARIGRSDFDKNRDRVETLRRHVAALR